MFCTPSALLPVGNSLNQSDEKSSTARRIIKAKPNISLPLDAEPLREREYYFYSLVHEGIYLCIFFYNVISWAQTFLISNNCNVLHHQKIDDLLINDFICLYVAAVATATPITNGNLSQSQTDGRPVYPRTQYSMARAHVTMDPSGLGSWNENCVFSTASSKQYNCCSCFNNSGPPLENSYSLQGGYDSVSSIPGGIGAPGPPMLHHTPNHSTYR